MDDADGDAETETDTYRMILNNRHSLWYVNTTGYAFWCIHKNMRS